MIMASPSPTSSPQPAMPDNTTSNDNAAHPPLQCPRCNSSNTKFCYYNNYSLSQPRHFCKACKRYWTRGGTLRNVPVGGGCRKNNKRLKRPSPADPKIDPPQASTHAAAATTTTTTTTSNNNNNPLFYSNIDPVDFPFSGFRSTRVCGGNNTGIDFQPPVNGHGLGFAPGLMAAADYDSSIFCGSSPGFASASTMASKIEGDQSRFGWSPDPNTITNLDQINCYYSDPSLLIGAWFDPSYSSMGSSVPSLI